MGGRDRHPRFEGRGRHRRAWFDRLVTLTQPDANIIGRQRLPSTFGPDDHHAGRGDAGQTGYTEKLPFPHDQGPIHDEQRP